MIVRMLQALTTDSPDEAFTFMTDVLTTAKPEDAIRIIADFGQLTIPLLRKAIAAGIEPEFAGKILTIIEDEAYQRKIKKGEIPPASSLLSEREREVLKLLESGLSNQQIAESLMVSLSTTKTHVHSILEKLEAKDRSQAIYRAKELNIL
jgi:LuxR family maltose regulon positive regulatory protein